MKQQTTSATNSVMFVS